MEPDFSVEELLALLEAQRGPQHEGLSSEEIAERLGRRPGWVLVRLRQLSRQGHITVSHRRSTRVDGRPCLTPVYSLKNGGEARKET